MQLSLIELSFSTVGNKVKKSNSENSAMLFWMTKNLCIKKPIGKKLPEVSKRIFPRREKIHGNYISSLLSHIFSIEFFCCIFIIHYSEAIFLVTPSKQIRLFGLQLNVYSRHSFSIWNGKNGRQERKKKRDGSVSSKCIFMLNHGIYSAMSFKKCTIVQ